MNNNIQLIVILIFLGISGLSWAARKMQEKAAEREAESRRKRREEEYLRTGRADDDESAASPAGMSGTASRPVDTADAQARLRELAAKRQAQLRELRQKQTTPSSSSDDSASTRTAPEKPETVRVEMWPGGPVFELGPAGQGKGQAANPTTGRKPATARSSPAPQRTPAPQPPPTRASSRMGPAVQQTPQQFADDNRKRQVRQVRAATETAAMAARDQRQEDADAERSRKKNAAAHAPQNTRAAMRAQAVAGAEADNAPAVTRVHAAFRTPTSPAGWRNAIILGEVLGTPVGLRDQPHTH